jgi:hypothetical protein
MGQESERIEFCARTAWFLGKEAPMTRLRSQLRAWRPWLEKLENRLPPGDALLGALVGWSVLDGNEWRFADDLSFRSDDQTFLNIHRPRVAGAERSEAPAEAPTTSRVHRGVEDSAPATDLDQRAAGLTPAVRHSGANSHARRSISDMGAMLSRPNVDGVSPEMFGREGMGAAPASMPSRPTPFTKNDPVAAGRDSMAPASISGGPNEKFGAMPFYFEQNVGQAGEGLDFVARAPGYTLGLSATEAIFAIENSEFRIQNSGVSTQNSELRTQNFSETHPSFVRMQLVGGNPDAPVTAVDPLVTKVNYFLGNDPNEWHTNIPTFGKVQYDDVYPGIDLVYYGNGGNLEYDFLVSPGADLNAIALNFAGADDISIADDGALVVKAGAAEIRQPTPYIYQEVNGTRQQVAGRFDLNSALSTRHSALGDSALPRELKTQHSELITFEIGTYDRARPLVIDPLVLGYSTYLGGGGHSDTLRDIAVDESGHVYITGETLSPKFPVTDGAFDTTYDAEDGFVAKLNEAGTALIYATYLGGSYIDEGRGITIDAEGYAYVTGVTASADFPTTPGSFDQTHSTDGLLGDGFVTKLSPDGSSVVYSTFLGGRPFSAGTDIAVDTAGSAFVFGGTASIQFPVTPGAYDTSFNGGTGDTFVTKLNPNGSALIYSTFLGGSRSDGSGGIAVDAAGNAYVAGFTTSRDFPTTPGAFQESLFGAESAAYITKFHRTGAPLFIRLFWVAAMGPVATTSPLMLADTPTSPDLRIPKISR